MHQVLGYFERLGEIAFAVFQKQVVAGQVLTLLAIQIGHGRLLHGGAIVIGRIDRQGGGVHAYSTSISSESSKSG
ncbi:hypothetical protein D3C73_1544700 [compost metagenome]